jgi:DNA-directed RNA polymerase sigma subunit (sigma70/sigma32)
VETTLAASWGNCEKKINRRCKLREIAEMWGMSKERVRQIQNRAVVNLIQGLKKEVGMT